MDSQPICSRQCPNKGNCRLLIKEPEAVKLKNIYCLVYSKREKRTFGEQKGE